MKRSGNTGRHDVTPAHRFRGLINAACNCLVVVIAVLLVRNTLSTYSLLKGPVGVAIETNLGTELFRTVPRLMLAGTLGAFGIGSAMVVLFRRRAWRDVRMLRMTFLFVSSCALLQVTLFTHWGRSIAKCFESYDLVVSNPDDNTELITSIGAKHSNHCSIRYESQKLILRVPPQLRDFSESVLRELIESGFEVQRKSPARE